MADVPLLTAEQHWECGKCPETHVTVLAEPHAPMHQCRGMAGLLVPYVAAGRRVKVTAAEREDYIGSDAVQLDGDGRPVMSVTIEDDNRRDAVVYAPAARGRAA